jgi:hypothetical protein
VAVFILVDIVDVFEQVIAAKEAHLTSRTTRLRAEELHVFVVLRVLVALEIFFGPETLVTFRTSKRAIVAI